MAPITAARRRRLPKSSFALPGKRKYPIDTIGRARNALARSSGKPEAGTVRAKVTRRYPSLKKAGGRTKSRRR
jgi:hypothetical protein